MTAAQAIRISAWCDQFEWEWRMGSSPRIDRVLDDASPEDREILFEDLLLVELELRRLSGEQPTVSDYLEHYPGRAEAIERVWRDSPPPADEPVLGMIGRYELLEELGRGGDGVVYRAREIGLVHYEVAVKLILAGKVRSRAAADRFVKEVNVLGWLRHDHVVPFLGSGEDRGQLYYVMQYMPNSSLARTLKLRLAPFDPYEAARLVQQVAEAVKYLHDNGVVHCDLKPHNILMDEAGKPHVADFGLARLIDDDRTDFVTAGTIPYIAPEQLDARLGKIGPSSDIYSLGVILFEVLTGETPFPREKGAILSILKDDPTPLRAIRGGIPRALERICRKCLRKAPTERYRTAGELVDDLEAFRKGIPLPHTRPDTTWQRLVDWARGEPALAARLAVIAACSVIIWSFRWSHLLVHGRLLMLPPDHWAYTLARSGRGLIDWTNTAYLVWATQMILIAWGLASWFFQRRLRQDRQSGGIQLGWRVADVIALALLIKLDDALMSPLTVAFAVLIGASGFWARADQIVQATLLSMGGYILLVLDYRYFHPDQDYLYRHFHYLVGLALLGMILGDQANRTRALQRICGGRDRS